jgi:hypothetical protein
MLQRVTSGRGIGESEKFVGVVKIQLRTDHFAYLAGGVCLEQFEEKVTKERNVLIASGAEKRPAHETSLPHLRCGNRSSRSRIVENRRHRQAAKEV